MKPVALLTLALLWAAPPAAVQPEPPKFEDSAVKERLKLLTDGKGHYLALDPAGSFRGPFFFGDGKVLYQLRSPGGGSSGPDQFSVSIWDPRIDWKLNGYASFDAKDGKYSISCHPKTTELTAVPAEEARKLLAGAVLYQPK